MTPHKLTNCTNISQDHMASSRLTRIINEPNLWTTREINKCPCLAKKLNALRYGCVEETLLRVYRFSLISPIALSGKYNGRNLAKIINYPCLLPRPFVIADKVATARGEESVRGIPKSGNIGIVSGGIFPVSQQIHECEITGETVISSKFSFTWKLIDHCFDHFGK